jgi:hypothetical protein
MMSVVTWDFAIRLANAEAIRTGVRQRVRKSRWVDAWLVSPVVSP